MAKKKNRTDVILNSIAQLNNEIDYTDFEYKPYFNLLCRLNPNTQEEKLDIIPIDIVNYKKQGLVYVFVIENKIFKIGHTITTIIKKIQSYNCGKIEYRISGTNSTTNYFVLQSLLKIGKTIDVYAYFPDPPQYEVFGKIFKDSYPIAKRAEHEIIENFMLKHNKKPIGCTQS